MPIYSYQCSDCHRIFDLERAMKDSHFPVFESPCCLAHSERVIVAAPTLKFVGKDWTPKHYQ